MAQKILDLKTLGEEYTKLIKSELAQPGANDPIAFTEGLQHVLMSCIAKTATHMAQRIEKRLAALESRTLEYRGVHETGKSYTRGSFVTYGGSMWHANEATSSRPGDGSAWTLAVKSGAPR